MKQVIVSDDYELCLSCKSNCYHCLCTLVGRPLTKKESAELYWLAATDIEKFNALCDNNVIK